MPSACLWGVSSGKLGVLRALVGLGVLGVLLILVGLMFALCYWALVFGVRGLGIWRFWV